MNAKPKPKGDKRRTPTKTDLKLVHQPEQTFKTQEELDAALKLKIANVGEIESGKNFIAAPGLCHRRKTGKALRLNIATGEVTCDEGCDYKAILRGFGLPTQPQADKADALTTLRDELGVQFKQVVKLGKTKANFDVELDDGLSFSLGSAGDVLRFVKVEEAIADATGHVIPSFSKAQWRKFAQLIFDAAEVVVTFSEADETRSWVEAFVAASRIRGADQTTLTDGMRGVNLDDKAALFKALHSIQQMAHKPHHGSVKGFVGSDKRVYLHIGTFMYFVNFNGLSAHRVSLPELAERLTRLGFRNRQFGARQGDEIAKARLWFSPAGFLDARQSRA